MRRVQSDRHAVAAVTRGLRPAPQDKALAKRLAAGRRGRGSLTQCNVFASGILVRTSYAIRPLRTDPAVGDNFCEDPADRDLSAKR